MPTSVRISLLAIASSLVACGGALATPSDAGTASQEGGAGVQTGDGAVPDGSMSPVGTIAGDKVDVLFMIDNSGGMADKQALLASSVSEFLQRLAAPYCVDPNDPSKVIAPSQGGACAAGVLEIKPVHDLHVGIVSSSLGGRGGTHATRASRIRSTRA